MNFFRIAAPDRPHRCRLARLEPLAHYARCSSLTSSSVTAQPLLQPAGFFPSFSPWRWRSLHANASDPRLGKPPSSHVSETLVNSHPQPISTLLARGRGREDSCAARRLSNRTSLASCSTSNTCLSGDVSQTRTPSASLLCIARLRAHASSSKRPSLTAAATSSTDRPACTTAT